VEVVVPDSIPLPESWSEYSNDEKDAWIFSNQSDVQDIFEDIHHATATDIEWAD
jgi:hypothetical protein